MEVVQPAKRTVSEKEPTAQVHDETVKLDPARAESVASPAGSTAVERCARKPGAW
jgi:hypothetical protein